MCGVSEECTLSWEANYCRCLEELIDTSYIHHPWISTARPKAFTNYPWERVMRCGFMSWLPASTELIVLSAYNMTKRLGSRRCQVSPRGPLKATVGALSGGKKRNEKCHERERAQSKQALSLWVHFLERKNRKRRMVQRDTKRCVGPVTREGGS